jgi:uncharacterized protein involved in propanediol utilization
MNISIVMAATRPWTYWIAPPLLVLVVLAVVVMAATYYRQVMVPEVLWKLEQQARQTQHTAASLGDVHHIGRPMTTSSERMAA